LNTLSINTSTNQYSLAVMKDEILLGEYILPSGPSRFSNLMPAIDDLFTKVGSVPQELDGVIVALGPGSFTGIRVGLAVAKGLSQCLGVPIIGVPTLSAFASQIPYVKEDICPLVASRRGEIFAALFRWDSEHQLSRIKEDTCIKMVNLGSFIRGNAIFIGNDLHTQGTLVKQCLGEKGVLAPAHLWILRASSIGALGLTRLQNGDSDSLSELVPIYLRDADIRSPKRF
jgi:tRNA threonylcarbamoyladenosine biosynthesis protein TsaB